MSTFKIHTHCDMGWTIRNQKANDNQNNTVTYSAYICCKKIKIPISFVLHNTNIQESYFVNSHTNYLGENTWSSTYSDNNGNMYPVYFSNISGFTKKLIPGFPLEGEGTFTFVYTVTTDDWNAYGPDSTDTENRWSGIPFFNPDDSLSFSMSAAEVGVDTIVSITVKSAGTQSALTGLSFSGNGTSDAINKTVKNNLTNFSKIVINDFGGVFLSRNRSLEFGQFVNLPTLSFEGKAKEAGPLILTGTSLRDCFALCDNFNENLNSWDFSEVVNMRSMFYGVTNTLNTTYQFNKSSNNPELGYLSINSESIEPATTYTIKVRQATDDNGLIRFRTLDYFTSQNRLDLLTVGGWTTLGFNNFQVEFDIQNVTFSGTVALSGESESDALWTFTVVSSSTMSPVVIPEETDIVFRRTYDAFNKFNNGGVQPNWNTQKVSSMRATFHAQNELNFEFQFDTSLVTNLSYMFFKCLKFNNGDQTGSSTKPLILNLPEAITLYAMFYECSNFNQEVRLLAPKSVTLSFMFTFCSAFNNPLILDLPKAVYLYYMFAFCYAFNNGDQAGSSTKPLVLNLPEALGFNYMFYVCDQFNQEVKLLAPKAESLHRMFGYCESFNNGDQVGSSTKPLILDLPEALDLSGVFIYNNKFNQEVTLLAPKAKTLVEMFNRCESFNNGDQTGSSTKPLILKLPEAIELNRMFLYNFSFNQEIKLLAPNANNVSYLLYNCTIFNNGDQSLMLELPEALDLSGMFEGNIAFNQTLILTAPKAQNLSSMFLNCTNFNNGGQYFTNKNGKFWDIPDVISMEKMLNNVALTSDIYSNFLVGCKNQIPNIQRDVPLDANIATPTDAGENAKTLLRNDYNWKISDAGS